MKERAKKKLKSKKNNNLSVLMLINKLKNIEKTNQIGLFLMSYKITLSIN